MINKTRNKGLIMMSVCAKVQEAVRSIYCQAREREYGRECQGTTLVSGIIM